jgi:hypothetical protein
MSDDAMVPIAHILGRGEALTVAAMLDAAGSSSMSAANITAVLPPISWPSADFD